MTPPPIRGQGTGQKGYPLYIIVIIFFSPTSLSPSHLRPVRSIIRNDRPKIKISVCVILPTRLLAYGTTCNVGPPLGEMDRSNSNPWHPRLGFTVFPDGSIIPNPISDVRKQRKGKRKNRKKKQETYVRQSDLELWLAEHLFRERHASGREGEGPPGPWDNGSLHDVRPHDPPSDSVCAIQSS